MNDPHRPEPPPDDFVAPPDGASPDTRRRPWWMSRHPLVRNVRRVIVAVIGGTVLLIGVVMVVTPGPAMVMIPIGLAILAIEFAWARRLLRKVKRQFESTIQSATGRRSDPN